MEDKSMGTIECSHMNVTKPLISGKACQQRNYFVHALENKHYRTAEGEWAEPI